MCLDFINMFLQTGDKYHWDLQHLKDYSNQRRKIYHSWKNHVCSGKFSSFLKTNQNIP